MWLIPAIIGVASVVVAAVAVHLGWFKESVPVAAAKTIFLGAAASGALVAAVAGSSGTPDAVVLPDSAATSTSYYDEDAPDWKNDALGAAGAAQIVNGSERLEIVRNNLENRGYEVVSLQEASPEVREQIEASTGETIPEASSELNQPLGGDEVVRPADLQKLEAKPLKKIDGNPELRDTSGARETLASVALEYVRAVKAEDATAETVGAAVQAYHEASTEYRNFLYEPLYYHEAVLHERLEIVAKLKKKKQELEERIEEEKTKEAPEKRDFGSKWQLARLEFDYTRIEDLIEKKLNSAMQKYKEKREKVLTLIYEGSRREGALIKHDPDLDELLNLGEDKTGRPAYGNLDETRTEQALKNRLKDRYSENRLQAYEDEAEVHEILSTRLREQGRDSLVSGIEEVIAQVEKLTAADKEHLEKSRGTEGDQKVDQMATSIIERVTEAQSE